RRGLPEHRPPAAAERSLDGWLRASAARQAWPGLARAHLGRGAPLRRASRDRARRRRADPLAAPAQPRGRERRRNGNPPRGGSARRLEASAAPRVHAARRGARGALAVELLESYRDRFPILQHTTYLISHSLGPMPVGAEENLLRYAREWRERGVRAWAEGWWDTSTSVGDQLARIFGAAPGTTVMHQNVAVAQAVVLSCFEFEPPRNRIVYGEGEFPSVRDLYQAHRRRGAQVEIFADGEAVLEAIDERTLLVPVSHVLFKTGEIQDVEAIVRRAHEAGALVVLDAYQSVGSVPLDVTRLGVDFAVGGSVKWLCGGPGAGWLYVRPELIERLEPTFTGWQAHARPFAFEPEQEYASGAARFLT